MMYVVMIVCASETMNDEDNDRKPYKQTNSKNKTKYTQEIGYPGYIQVIPVVIYKSNSVVKSSNQ